MPVDTNLYLAYACGLRQEKRQGSRVPASTYSAGRKQRGLRTADGIARCEHCAAIGRRKGGGGPTVRGVQLFYELDGDEWIGGCMLGIAHLESSLP